MPFNFGVAAALFYLAELVEEYTVITAKVIKCTIAVSIIKLNQSVNFNNSGLSARLQLGCLFAPVSVRQVTCTSCT